MRAGTQEMSGVLDVKGAATLASASESDIPAFAAFNAPQSFAPSPHIITWIGKELESWQSNSEPGSATKGQ